MPTLTWLNWSENESMRACHRLVFHVVFIHSDAYSTVSIRPPNASFIASKLLLLPYLNLFLAFF
jgi:hypothetical protein